MGQTGPDKESTRGNSAGLRTHVARIAWLARKAPRASFDEIAAQVTPRRRVLMGKLLAQLACQHRNGEEIEGLQCPDALLQNSPKIWGTPLF